jgi:type IV secretory pathway TraG/TraD family ATPase VirD4
MAWRRKPISRHRLQAPSSGCFVQDLSQLKAVYPRWQSFLANTSQQFFGTADYDTARYISDALGQRTIRFETESRSQHSAWRLKPGTVSAATGEQIQGRSLLTPDEVMRLGALPADHHDRRRAALAP